MRIIARKTLREFWLVHVQAEHPLKAWFTQVKRAAWSTPAGLNADFGSASFLANNRVVFNIKGNEYRLVAWVRYDFKAVYIRFVGTHEEYDKIDAARV